MLDYVYTDFNKNIYGTVVDAVAAANTGTLTYGNEKAVNFRAQFDF
jgi:hypothetical protein